MANPPLAFAQTFDLVRLSKAKAVVDISPEIIRRLHQQGRLAPYRLGGAIFFSASELSAAIRCNPVSLERMKELAPMPDEVIKKSNCCR